MNFHSTETQKIVAHYKSDVNKGLTGEDAAKRLLENGANSLSAQNKTSLLGLFFEQFKDFMIIILLVTAVVSVVISYLRNDIDFVDPIIILAIVVLNAILGVTQQSRAEKALKALKKMSAPCAHVLRDGKMQKLPTEQVVVGDIIELNLGNYVPADARLLSSTNLQTEEAALTGESAPVDKNANVLLKDETAIGDRVNMVLATTSVARGRGTAIVTAVGMDTEVGKIAGMIMDSTNEETPLQKKLSSAGKTLATGALIICAIIFFIGVLRSIPAFEMFMTSVSLAVAAIPEGLPAIVTIMLSIGVMRMAKNNAIIRCLPAVETLGGATVICSDKTGTLTQNKMKVTDIYGNKDFSTSLAALCCNGTDPTELALMAAFEKDISSLQKEYPRVNEISFDSVRKLMSTIHKTKNGYRIITKGAPDILLEHCTKYYDGEVHPLNAVKKKELQMQNSNMADKALRVIAIAYKDVTIMPKNDAEMALTFVGLIGMIDPPRKEARDAVRLCQRAGIRTVMITGDHVSTAVSIAKQLGIMSGLDAAMTGADLDKMSDGELKLSINNIKVFARVSPEHKVRIVKALKSRGEIVAMTGDGVNDAPALKAADIGCAMGMTGTDVARGAADMVLTDDNFATIVKAIGEGRGIYANIQKAVHFLLSSNIGEILVIFLGILFGWSSPLLAIQLLWVNLVTDSLPAIALGLDGASPELMDDKPRNPKRGLFADGLWFNILVEGCMIGSLGLLAFSIGANIFDAVEPMVGRTMAFCVLSLSQLVHAFNMCSPHSIFKKRTRNIWLVGALLIGTFLQCSVVSIPYFAKIFKVTALTPEQWLIVAALSLVPLFVIEIEKFVRKK